MRFLELLSVTSNAAVCLALVALATIPSLLTFKQRLSRGPGRNRPFHLYEDEDGTATEESQAAFSDSAPRYGILLGSLVGLVASFTTAICVTVSPGSTVPCFWLLFATSVCYDLWLSLLLSLRAGKTNAILSFLGLCKHSSSLATKILVVKRAWDSTHRSRHQLLWSQPFC